jgi:hypothetical protein
MVGAGDGNDCQGAAMLFIKTAMNDDGGGTRQLGQAASTARANDSALRLYDIYRARRGKLPFDQMRDVEIA